MTTELAIEGYLVVEEATPADALGVKNALEAQIVTNQLGSVVGGGCEISSPKFDLQVNTDNPQQLEEFLRALLKEKNFDEDLQLTFTPRST